jgi:hypothetical protein
MGLEIVNAIMAPIIPCALSSEIVQLQSHLLSCARNDETINVENDGPPNYSKATLYILP